MQEPKFVVPQKAAIQKDGKFLVMKRSPDDDIFPGHWDFPGGKLEFDEIPSDGLKREVKEECGLEIEVVMPEFLFVEKTRALRYAAIIIFECKAMPGEVKLSKEHTKYKWATKEELLEMKLEPYLRAYLERK